MATRRIGERELVLPSLYLMTQNDGIITTTELTKVLREILKPTGEDAEILAGRSDDKFSQKVRNLKSHDTFQELGFAKYKKEGNRGRYELTAAGRKHLQDNKDILTYLLVNDFQYKDIIDNLLKVEGEPKRKPEAFDENVMIQEGYKRVVERQVFERSRKLRDYAVSQFTIDGRISCQCCEFNFNDFYGFDLARGYIEIHHQKPVFKYEDEDLERTMAAALGNLLPVCSNCHRIIHRDLSATRDADVLLAGMRNNGVYRGKKMW